MNDFGILNAKGVQGPVQEKLQADDYLLCTSENVHIFKYSSKLEKLKSSIRK